MAENPWPNLGARARWSYLISWVILFALAVVACVNGWDRAVERLGVREVWPWAIPSGLFLLVALVALPAGRRNRPAALLALSMLLLASTNFVAQPFWTDISRLAREIVANIGWLSLIATLLLYPRGDFSVSWGRWVLLATAAFLVLDIVRFALAPDSTVLTTIALIGLPGCFALALLALAACLTRLPHGLERQRIDWLFAGFFLGLICIVAPLGASFLLDVVRISTAAHESVLGIIPLLVPIGFSLFALALVVALSGDYPRLGRFVLKWSAIYGLVTLILTLVFGFVDLVLKDFLQAQLGEDTGYFASLAFTAVSALLVKPLGSRARNWAKAKFAPVASPA